MKRFRFIVGDATRTKIERILSIPAKDLATAQTEANAEVALDGTRVVNDDSIAERLLQVADDSGQMVVSKGSEPAKTNPIDKYNVRAIHDKIVAGEMPSPSELVIYSAVIGTRAIELLPRTAEWPNKTNMESLRDKLIADTITDAERDDALQYLLEHFVGTP